MMYVDRKGRRRGKLLVHRQDERDPQALGDHYREVLAELSQARTILSET
jgi:hypothetical protein